MKTIVTFAAAAALFATPAWAQQEPPPFAAGNFVDVNGIRVAQGQGNAFNRVAASLIRNVMEPQKEQGWIVDYQMYDNTHPRDGEPDVYLVVTFADFMSQDEMDARRAEMASAFAAMMEEAGLEPGWMSELIEGGNRMLLREMNLRE